MEYASCNIWWHSRARNTSRGPRKPVTSPSPRCPDASASSSRSWAFRSSSAVSARAIRDHHPEVELTVLSQSSIEILRHLEDLSIDVGLTYLDNEPIEGMRSEAIYMERYCLLVRADHPSARASSVSWADAANEPLCLLTPRSGLAARPCRVRLRSGHGAAGDLTKTLTAGCKRSRRVHRCEADRRVRRDIRAPRAD
jgi:DNA-binding transcriptional LysR family regulator